MMTLEQIKLALVQAANKVVSPHFSIHSYRGGEWQLVASYNDAISTAETYHSFAVHGTWGDWLEVRCNGFKVSL